VTKDTPDQNGPDQNVSHHAVGGETHAERLTPGEMLGAARRKSGLNLDQMAEGTKIPQPMLLAIEQDEYHKISGELYVKSFLRAYAKEVGLDAEEVLERYLSFTGTAPAVTGAEGDSPGVWRDEEVQIKRLGLPWKGLAIAAFAVVLLVFGGYLLLRGNGDESPAEGTNPAGVQPVPGDSLQSATHRESLLAAGPLKDQLAVSDPPPPPATEGAAAASEALADPAPRLMPAPEGKPGETVIDGEVWPVVLRLMCPDQREISVKKDGQREYKTVNWAAPEAVLPSELVAGRGYPVRDGWVVFWGGEDHFSIRVNDSLGVQATINGEYRDLGGLRQGQELILNDPAVIRSNLPPHRP
jgi:cytoskeletal protein RodZ